MHIHEAVNAPNFTKMNNILELEENSHFADYKIDLEKRGHQVKIRDLTSGIHAIYIDRKNDEIIAGIDKRRDGTAAGE
jgi:gamma-glutamyltranspeptidase/glutathione hydrolase